MWEKDIHLGELEQGDLFFDEKLFKSVFRALGKDYVNICLLDTTDRTVRILKGRNENRKGRKLSDGVCCHYENVCQNAVLSNVLPKDRDRISRKIKFERVMEILSYKPEYSFTYENMIFPGKRLCTVLHALMQYSISHIVHI